MADLNYLFSTLYGFEPFDPTTTGAKLTGHNLVVTAWEVADKGGDPFVEVGALLQPSTENDNLSQARRVGSSQVVDSRCSAQFFFEASGVKPIPLLNGLIFLALNPPPELRQQWAQALLFNGGDPTDLANYTVKKSLMGGYTWRWTAEECDSSQNLTASSDMLATWGTYLDLGDLTGAPDNSYPLLKTSGADGQQPQFFDRSTAQGVQEMIAAVDAGNFFVPMTIAADFSDSIRLTLTYPHSSARA